jgi:hypothetical protein
MKVQVKVVEVCFLNNRLYEVGDQLAVEESDASAACFERLDEHQDSDAVERPRRGRPRKEVAAAGDDAE